MMKIGIVTLPLRNNFGGILQNYALQTVLKQMGHRPVTLLPRFRPWKPTQFRFYVVLAKNMLKKCMGYHAPDYINPAKQNCPPQHEFIERYITKIDWPEYVPLTPGFCKSHDFEAYVVGSDQVWRPRYSPRLEHCFLDFTAGCAVRRIAYAVSFGVDVWEYTPEQTRTCSELVRGFDAVSVRENSGVGLCREYLGVNAAEVLDPTLLLDKDDYNRLCRHIAPCSDRYMAVYMLDRTPWKLRFIKDMADAKQLPIRYLGRDLSVEGWLAMFRDAAFVLTDSFHGSVFSIIYQKDFFSIVNDARGAARFTSLFARLGLSERLVPEMSHGEIEARPVEWEKVSDALNGYRAKSRHFLNDSLDIK